MCGCTNTEWQPPWLDELLVAMNVLEKAYEGLNEADSKKRFRKKNAIWRSQYAIGVYDSLVGRSDDALELLDQVRQARIDTCALSEEFQLQSHLCVCGVLADVYCDKEDYAAAVEVQQCAKDVKRAKRGLVERLARTSKMDLIIAEGMLRQLEDKDVQRAEKLLAEGLALGKASHSVELYRGLSDVYYSVRRYQDALKKLSKLQK